MEELIERAHRGEASAAELEELAAWRASGSANERRYTEVVRLLEATAALRSELALAVPPSAEALLARREPGRAPGARSLASPASPRGWRAGGWRRTAPWALAAAAMVLLVINVASPGDGPVAPPAEVVTGAGEIATVQLGDGSVVRLAPSSRLRLGEEGDPRIVALEGRAFFSVSRVEGHPFRVRTRAATATVLGTRFEITTAQEDLRLVVVEGRVGLEAPENRVEVAAGEQSAVSNRVAARPVPVEDTSRLLQWAGRFLVFQGTPLRDAAREIGATYDVAVTITDAELARRTITAVFTGQSLDAVLDVVCTVVDARCTLEADEITMSPR